VFNEQQWAVAIWLAWRYSLAVAAAAAATQRSSTRGHGGMQWWQWWDGGMHEHKMQWGVACEAVSVQQFV
jgi:hypothetical protein